MVEIINVQSSGRQSDSQQLPQPIKGEVKVVLHTGRKEPGLASQQETDPPPPSEGPAAAVSFSKALQCQPSKAKTDA
ncbi:hypothetical protein PBY51_021886 [Eleginops maclovinus]|uniref:Uncharacterized protein n=1 Tax=Eleginops maclovinus TaxID=56733 RepID=A0AAN7XGR5_ELEMC|nr:hypothetical protein PBY51_021886 [Eleginops maclovinus]